MSLRSILRPGKGKIFLDAFFSAVWLAAVFNVTELGFQQMFSAYDPQSRLVVAALNFVVFLIIFYPLACGAVHIYRRLGRKESSSGKDLLLAVIMVVVFNPLFFSLVMIGINEANTEVLNRPCGLEITGFPEYSVAMDSGIRIGETITSVDGKTVDTTDALLSSLKDKKEGDDIRVGTDKGEYKIKIVLQPPLSDRPCWE